MNDLFDDFEGPPGPAPFQAAQRVGLAVGVLLVVLMTAIATLAVDRSFRSFEDPAPVSDGEANSSGAARPSVVPLPFGAQDVTVDSVTVPAHTTAATSLHFEIDVDPTPTSSPRTAMVSFRVECSDDGGAVEMSVPGNATTNVFLSRGGTVSGQALTAESREEMGCALLASAQNVEVEGDGLSSLPLQADLRLDSAEGTHVPALRRLDDATLIEPGTLTNVLSRQVDDPSALDRMSTTVGLTSCTVVGGSQDLGENKCRETTTGSKSSTVRIRVIARWLDKVGSIESTSTYWVETLAVNRDTHYLPWNLKQAGLGSAVPEDAKAVVLVVQVESIEGAPVVVQASGTGAVITTSS